MSLRPYEQRPVLAAWGAVKRARAKSQFEKDEDVAIAHNFAQCDPSGIGASAPAWTDLPAEGAGDDISSRVLETNWSLLCRLPRVRGSRAYAQAVDFIGANPRGTWLGELEWETVRSRQRFQVRHLSRILQTVEWGKAETALYEPAAVAALRALGWDEARTVLATLPAVVTGSEAFPTRAKARREMRRRKLARGVLRMLRAKTGRGELSDVADGPVVDQARQELRRALFDLADVWMHLRSKVRFHADRSKAQRLRFPRHSECGQGVMVVHCQCGREAGYRVGCQVGRLCVRCRDRLMQRRRARFFDARQILMRRDRFKAHHDYPGGRWSEKHVVLTIPHFGAGRGRGVPTERIEVFWRARHDFGRSMQRYFRRRGIGGVHYLRGFEWTPGSDGLGHPHIHVWLWSPFVSQRAIRFMWARALRKSGLAVPARPTDSDLRVRVREVKIRKKEIIREVAKGGKAFRLQVYRGGDDLVGYLESWSVTETQEGRRVPAWVMGEVYAALEGKRQGQASRGFLKLADRECACRECGSVGTLVATVFPPGDPIGKAWAEHFGLDINPARAGPSLVKGANHDDKSIRETTPSGARAAGARLGAF